MRFRSLVTVLLLLLAAARSADAQVAVSSAKGEAFGQSVHGLGFSLGFASGAGISYRYHMASKSSVQGVVGVFKPKSTDTFYSFGAEFQQDLTRSGAARFFFAAATSYNYNGTTSNNYTAPFRAGLGLGGEFLMQDAVHISLEGMFTYFSDGTILPLPQMSIHYYFY